MRKILLIGPNKRTSGKENWGAPPLGIHRLATHLRRNPRNNVTVLDPSQLQISDRVFRGMDYIGFSVLAETLPQDIEMIVRARTENPESQLIVGGVEATLNYQQILEHTDVDWIVLGNGEEAIWGIVGGLPAERIPGIIRRTRANILKGDDLWRYYERMDFSQMGYESYWNDTARMYDNPNWRDIRTVRLVTSTHCNRGCSFCSVTQWHKAAVGKCVPPAMLSGEQLISLVEKVKREVPNTETIFFCEDDFCQNKERVRFFCERSAGKGVGYLVQTHSSCITESLVDVLAQGGCRHITIGVENASMDVLRSFNKTQKLENIPKFIRWCTERDICPYILIILFAPSSKLSDLWENYRVLSDWIDQGAVISIEPYTMPYRGAPLYDSLHEFQWSQHITGSNKTPIKQADIILPDDSSARALMLQFQRRWPEYKSEHAATHSFKGNTGKLILRLLGELLDEYSGA